MVLTSHVRIRLTETGFFASNVPGMRCVGEKLDSKRGARGELRLKHEIGCDILFQRVE